MSTARFDNIYHVIRELEYSKLQVADFSISPATIASIAQGARIARGGMASMVIALGPDKVIKRSSPCADRSSLMQEQCNHLKNMRFEQYPYGGKVAITLPNVISESIIGGYLDQIIRAPYTLHFAGVLGSWIDVSDVNNPLVYSVAPRYQGGIENVIRSVEDVYMIFFQVSQGLATAQELYKFTHYDLHPGNILYEDLDPSNIPGFRYPIYDTRNNTYSYLYVQNRGYSTKMIDYGLSRMETDYYMISGQQDTAPSRRFSLFNRYIDIVSIARTWLFGDAGSPANVIRGRDPAAYSQMVDDILKIIFPNYTNIQDLTRKYFPTPSWWAADATKKFLYAEVNDMHTIVRLLGERLVGFNVAEPYNAARHPYSRLIKPLPKYDFIYPWLVQGITDSYIKSGVRGIDSFTKTTVIAPGILLDSVALSYNQVTKDWQMESTDREDRKCPEKIQVMHILYINLAEAEANGYKLKQDCCKLDTMSYVSDKFGVAVSGTINSVNDAFSPVGHFKMKKYDQPPNNQSRLWKSKVPIPGYENDYAAVILPSDVPGVMFGAYPQIQTLNRQVLDTILETNDNTDMFMAPLLVDKGRSVITPQTFDRIGNIQGVSQPVPKYKCLNEPDDPNRTVMSKERVVCRDRGNGNFSTTRELAQGGPFPNCARKLPGELFDMSNPNPRAMMVLRNSNDGRGNLAFVYVEGENTRGMGVDAMFMADTAIRIEGVQAVALAGDRSAAISWRTDRNPDIVMTTNPEQKSFYPVANILAIVRE